MTGTMVQLPRELEMLIDSRLDTIERMLVGRVPRQDRLAIVREVESQIYELLQEGEHEEPSRDSVLAVLARLDPPEAYLPDDTTRNRPGAGSPVSPAGVRMMPVQKPGNLRAAQASGILGLIALFLPLLSPLPYALGMALQSEIVMIAGWGAEILAVLALGVVGIVLGIYSRFKGAWAIVGVVTSAWSILLVLVAFVSVLLFVISGG
jgi:VIT1/CCC1 family predicted Fe2+/Mn2+ transporter